MQHPGIWATLRGTVADEGLAGLYRGCAPTLLVRGAHGCYSGFLTRGQGTTGQEPSCCLHGDTRHVLRSWLHAGSSHGLVVRCCMQTASCVSSVALLLLTCAGHFAVCWPQVLCLPVDEKPLQVLAD
jgi:hypothetical protein